MTHSPLPRLAVLASGTGSLLEAFVEDGLDVAVVLTDRACGAERIAERAGLISVRVERRDFGSSFDRDGYTDAVVAELGRHATEIVAMAGYGTILARAMIDAYPGRIVNTHPALLPAFKGWHAVEAALAAGVSETGCTVHIATVDVDDGPILAQQAVPILPGDTAAVLHERIKVVERRLYPETLRSFIDTLATERRGARAPVHGAGLGTAFRS